MAVVTDQCPKVFTHVGREFRCDLEDAHTPPHRYVFKNQAVFVWGVLRGAEDMEDFQMPHEKGRHRV